MENSNLHLTEQSSLGNTQESYLEQQTQALPLHRISYSKRNEDNRTKFSLLREF